MMDDLFAYGGRVSIAELFERWLVCRHAEWAPGRSERSDDEIDRATDEEIALECEILEREPETEADREAQLAILVYCAVGSAACANYGNIARFYRRLIIDRMTDPVARQKEKAQMADFCRYGGVEAA